MGKQMPITYIFLGLLPQNKRFFTPLKQVNKMASGLSLLVLSFNKKEVFKIFFSNMQLFYPMYSMLYTDYVLFLDTYFTLTRRLDILIEYSFFSEVVIVTFELLEDTRVVLVDNLATLEELRSGVVAVSLDYT